MDPQVRTQPFLHPVDEQPANMVDVQMGQYHVGYQRKIDAGSLQTMPNCSARGNS